MGRAGHRPKPVTFQALRLVFHDRKIITALAAGPPVFSATHDDRPKCFRLIDRYTGWEARCRRTGRESQRSRGTRVP
jgi:hypothetical protein